MSAYIMEEEGFQLLADELASRAESSNNVCDLNYELSRIFRVLLGFDESCFKAPSDAHAEAALFCDELYRANVDAVNQRYGEQEEAVGLNFRRQNYWPQWTPAALYKSLQCLRYQMSEGDVPEREIYKRLDALLPEIASAIVSHSEEYERAEWGWTSAEKRAA